MRKMKRIAALGLAGIMAFGLTACGGKNVDDAASGAAENSGPQEATEPGTAAKEGGRTLVISMESVTAEADELRKDYFDKQLKAAFPNDNITIDVASDAQSLQVQVAGGSGPDLFHLNGPTDAVEYAKAERIIDLSAYADQYNWKDLFYDWAYGTSYYDGKLYSLPNSFEGMVIYYNTDVFEANGWEKPETLDELLMLCDDAQAKGIIPFSFGNSDYQGAVDWLYSTFLSCYAGPDAMKEALEGSRSWTDPQIKGGIETMVDWWQKGYIGDKKSQALTGDDMVSLFANGKAAMMIDGTWASNSLITTYPDCKWDVEVMPEIHDGSGRILPLATGGCFAVNKSCKDPDFAAEVLNWIYTGNLETHIRGVVEAGFQPFPIKTIDPESFNGMNEKMLDMYQALFDGMDSGKVGYCSWTFFPSTARNYMNENTDALFLGQLGVDDYLNRVEELVKAAVADGSAPQLP